MRAAIFLAVALGAMAQPWTATANSSTEEGVSRERIEAALNAVRPALVKLTVVSRHFSEGRAVRFPSSGSGVIVSAEGDLLTNFHVAGKSARIQATLASGEIVDADVVTHDPLTDLSVLRLRLADRAADSPPLVPAKFSARAPRVGEPVLALGNPLTLASSVTLGIISNTRRVFTDFIGSQLEDLDLEGEPTGLFTQWLQHDALILPGNSGGPLVDLYGEIVGINELGGSGVGFAIPGELAKSVLERALAEGRVRRADLGLAVLPVTKLGRSTGALVSSVVPGSPAERAGVLAGDLLLAISGEQVAVRFFEEVPELYRRISQLPIGTSVTLDIERSAIRRQLSAAPSELEEAVGEEAEFRELGIAAQEVTVPMALARRIEPRSGVLVTSLRTGSPAANAKPALVSGDLLTELGGLPVRSLDDLRSALETIGRGEKLALVRRRSEQLLAVVEIEEGRSGRRGGELPKAWLGVSTQVVTPTLARALARPDLRGFRVTQVLPWTEAERAGLRVDDVLVAIDGEPLEAERDQDAENLRRVVEARGIGESAELTLVRQGHESRLQVKLEPRPRDPSEARSVKQELLGFAVRDVTLFDRVEFHWDRNQQGVLVTEIVNGGWAQMAGLGPDDLVLSIAESAVVDVATFESVLRELVAARPEVVQIFVRRRERTHFVFLEPEWNGSAKSTEEKR